MSERDRVHINAITLISQFRKQKKNRDERPIKYKDPSKNDMWTGLSPSEMFERWCTNEKSTKPREDLMLTEESLVAGFQAYRLELDTVSVRDIFRYADSDNDGLISYDEFQVAFGLRPPPPPKMITWCCPSKACTDGEQGWDMELGIRKAYPDTVMVCPECGGPQVLEGEDREVNESATRVGPDGCLQWKCFNGEVCQATGGFWNTVTQSHCQLCNAVRPGN